MIDPVTAIATATKSFAMIKAFVEAGKSAEDTFLQVSKWYSSASDILYLERKASNPNPFKKVVFTKSVEAEAVELFAHKKKIEAQRKEIYDMINLAYGAQGLSDLRQIKEGVIRDRQRQVYKQEELKETFLAGVLILIMIAILVATTLFILT